MPIRKNGDSVVFYDQAVQEWKKATVERYIRGYGYQVNYEEDGSTYQGKCVYDMRRCSPKALMKNTITCIRCLFMALPL